MITNRKKWWSDLPLSTRCRKAMRAIDRVDSDNWENKSLEDFKVILSEGKLQMLRGVGQDTENEFRKILGIENALRD